MALNQALSPWPTTPAARAAAITRLHSRILGELAPADDEGTCTLGELAAARVEREAPGAPQSIKDAAVIRYAGYMGTADFGALAEQTIGPLTRKWPVNHANAWRNSGAAGLLAPWKIRRAGVIA